MGIIYLLIVVIIVLISIIIKNKTELRKISMQIEKNLNEYTNIKTSTIDKDIEKLVININLLYDERQKVVAAKKKTEEELRQIYNTMKI